MTTARQILEQLLSHANPGKAAHLQRFFKTAPGEYAAGDVFLGITVPLVRQIVRAKRNDIPPLSEIQILLADPRHEVRLCALLFLVERFKRANPDEQAALVRFYLENACHDRVNNWDLVDLSAPGIFGVWLLALADSARHAALRDLFATNHLWQQRIAIVATLTLIRAGQFTETISLAQNFVSPALCPAPHDLLQKAIGWMLREIGKRDRPTLTAFLDSRAPVLPRTALRYAIEHYPQPLRRRYLAAPRK